MIRYKKNPANKETRQVQTRKKKSTPKHPQLRIQTSSYPTPANNDANPAVSDRVPARSPPGQASQGYIQHGQAFQNSDAPGDRKGKTHARTHGAESSLRVVDQPVLTCPDSEIRITPVHPEKGSTPDCQGEVEDARRQCHKIPFLRNVSNLGPDSGNQKYERKRCCDGTNSKEAVGCGKIDFIGPDWLASIHELVAFGCIESAIACAHQTHYQHA